MHHRHQRALAAVAGATLGAAGLVGLVGQPADAAGATLVVGNPATCADAAYRTINAAIADATSGDTISVCAGSYGEQVVVDKPGLTFTGATTGMDPRKKLPRSQTIVSNPSGDFVLQGDADDTTIRGFTLTGASDISAAGVLAFQGSSGLTLTENLIEFNGNGVNMANPDGSMPATITRNNFLNNSANSQAADANDENGTGIFISNGPADSTQITQNAFSQHYETAINFAGDGTNPSTGLVVSENTSTNDATFVVAINSTSAVIDDNVVKTDSPKVPGGEHGSGILDFGSNTNLRITANKMKATGTTGSSGINLRDFSGPPSSGTTVSNNAVSGWLNDLRIDDGSQGVVASRNKLSNASNDGILVGGSVSGAVISNNKITMSGTLACEDQSMGSGTAGTANSWTGNRGGGDASMPPGICS